MWSIFSNNDYFDSDPVRTTIQESAILAIWIILWVLTALGFCLLFAAPASAVEINPSVEKDFGLCTNELTGWTCDIFQGSQGTQGPAGRDNLTSIFYNTSYPNITASNATFWNVFNLTSVRSNTSYFNNTYGNYTISSNITNVYGGTYYNITGGAINESYAYLPGRPGGQTVYGGTGANDDLALSGTSSSTKTTSYVNLQPNGGFVNVGNTTSTTGVTNIYSTDNNILIQGISGIASSPTTGGAFLALVSNDGAALANGDRLGGFFFAGSVSSTTLSGYRAGVVAYTNDDYTTTHQGADLTFETTASGTTARTKKLWVTGDGRISTIANPTSQLDIIGSVRLRNCTGTPTFDSGGNLTCVSDEKLKTNVKRVSKSGTTNIDKIMHLSPVCWNWKPETGYSTLDVNCGFLAGEVKLIFPDVVITKKDINYKQVLKKKGKTPEENEYETVEEFTGTTTDNIEDRALIQKLVLAMQEQQTQIEQLQAEVARLEGKKVDKT